LKNDLNIKFVLKNIKKLLLFAGVSLLLFSCENDIEKIQSIGDKSELPDVSAKKIEIIYSDSAKTEMRLTADEVKRFSNVERPYMEFPKGIYVEFFDDSLDIESLIRADYAIYYTEDKIWEARGNVVANNLANQEKLNTEELFWDENDKSIYSNSFSRIENPDGIFYGEKGFESNQKFTKWRLKGSRGTVNFKDQGDNEKQ
jgi:lipopolysaccharide export system protein LptC